MERYIKDTKISNIHHISEINPEDLISLIQNEVEDLKSKGYKNIKYNIEYDWDSAAVMLTFDRIETDREYKSRLQREQKEADRRREIEEQERQEYERLKQKFGA